MSSIYTYILGFVLCWTHPIGSYILDNTNLRLQQQIMLNLVGWLGSVMHLHVRIVHTFDLYYYLRLKYVLFGKLMRRRLFMGGNFVLIYWHFICNIYYFKHSYFLNIPVLLDNLFNIFFYLFR